MRFYQGRHKYYCGIDLHTTQMYLCITDNTGNVLLHRNMKTDPELFTSAIAPYREDIAVAVECVFVWYWICDLCASLGVTFVLGHALYMKAIHGGKVKNDKIDSQKIVQLLRSGMLPVAYAYPREWRATRDLLRRRLYLTRKHAELSAHIQNVRQQHNMRAFEKNIHRASNRVGIEDAFDDPTVRLTIAVDSGMMESIHKQILSIERHINDNVHRHHDPVAVHLLRSVPGVGKTLALVILYEIGDITRFSRVGRFLSYARLVKCAHESAGKRAGGGNSKIGNVHLKWAFGEASCLFLRDNDRGKAWQERLVSKYGKSKALSIIAQRLGRAVYSILKTRTAFDERRFYQSLE